jgi:tetratricopeptide (TPR) repeat protein
MREAERQRDAAVLESRRADAQVAFQEVLLSEVGDRPVTMREILDAGRSVLERQSADDPSLRTSLLLQLADMYGSLHDTETRATLLGRAESLAVAGSAPELLPEVGCQTADNLRLEGRYEEAWRKLDESLDLLRATSPRDPQVEVACLLAHSHLASEAGSTGGRTEEAIPAARRGLAIRDSLGQTVDTTYAGLLSVLADGLQQAGEEREASGILRRAIALMDSVGRGGTIDRSILRHNLALSLVKIGEIDDAEAIFQEVLRIVQQADPSGWIAWQPLVHYAETALTQAHPDSALKYFQIIVTQAVRDTSLYWEGRGSFGTARALVQLGRLAEARRAKDRLEEIIALHPQVKRTDDQVPDGRTLDGWLALAEGDTAAAKSAFMASLRANGYFEGERRRQLRPVVLLVGECTLALGQEREALEWARQALAIAAVDSLAHARSAAVGEARLLEARALLESGDSNGARAAAHRAWSALRVGAGPQHPQTRAAETLVRSLRS